ncbi:hypothetical protein Taro_023703 [Colocasia esculenta]|uniref:Rab-GAP TBC domain-containing protein n=1 Tax=Colocasia esculenta TaxID=4460 RepID=A0A843V941_COLES|nr:hypothetical protein [Colocasia esculenta]
MEGGVGGIGGSAAAMSTGEQWCNAAAVVGATVMKKRKEIRIDESAETIPHFFGFVVFDNLLLFRVVGVVVVGSSAIASGRRFLSATIQLVLTHRANLKSPWSRRRRKRGLYSQQWNALFSPDGKLQDEVKFLKKVRSGGVEPRIRAKVWPFLLGVYGLNSSEADRIAVETQKREEFVKLRHLCAQLSGHSVKAYKKSRKMDSDSDGEGDGVTEVPYSPISDYISSSRQSLSIEGTSPGITGIDGHSSQSIFIGGGSPADASSDQSVSQPILTKGEKSGHSIVSCANSAFREEDKSGIIHADASTVDTNPSDTDSSVEAPDCMHNYSETAISDVVDHYANIDPLKWDSFRSFTSHHTAEDYVAWQRIIRLDALRANAEWVPYSSSQVAVSEDKACYFADSVGLKDYEHLEPYRTYHAARLVAILEAYAIYDSEVGYCQGMSDLLSPIVAVMEDDNEAFWCFVGFMRKARHNFRLDEVGIKRQLNIVSKIIRYKDAHLYRHLEKLQAEDCFFVYRMVVVMLRRELSFEQTLCLWEVMWADQAAIQAGIGKSAWGRTRLQAPPTDDLLLYAVAACILRKRKLITEKYSSMDEILRECNSLAGHLDVWRLLDDAHELVVTLHDKL